MYWIVGQKENRYLHICVKDIERKESLRLMRQLGYKIIEDYKLKRARFHNKESVCLKHLRREIDRIEKSPRKSG